MAWDALDQLLRIGQRPIDQGQLNQAIDQQNTIPPMLRAPASEPVAQPFAAAVPDMPATIAPKKKALDMMSERFKSFMPQPEAGLSPELQTYTTLSDNALKDHSDQLSGLNQYINEMAAKPRGINFTPLAAFVDSMTGSKLAPTVQATAPQSQEEKDQMLFGLRQQLASGQSKLSSEQLKALQDRQSYEQGIRRQIETERHNLASEQAMASRFDSLGQRALIAKDNQTSHAVDLATNDKQLNLYAPRIQGADRILGQLSSARAGHFLDTPQFLADVNSELSALLTGSSNAALGKQERTEYTTARAKIASIIQNASSEPQGINSPKILAQIESQVRELQATYKRNYGLRADQLKRTWANNPEATRQNHETLDNLKGQFAGETVVESPKAAEHDEAIAWAKANLNGPNAEKAARILKLHGG